VERFFVARDSLWKEMLHRERFFVWRDFVESVFVESVFVGIEASWRDFLREEIISKERRAPGRTRLALNCSRTVYNLLIWLNYFL
jgi:hypothetical protein